VELRFSSTCFTTDALVQLDTCEEFMVKLASVSRLMSTGRTWLKSWAGGKRRIVLFLAPEAGLTPFYASHAILAKTLNEAGHTAIMLSCNGWLPVCSWKWARGMKPTASGDNRNVACEQCRSQSQATRRDYGLTDVSLESLLGPMERSKIAEILKNNSAALSKMTYEDIAFGPVAGGEILRSSRRLDVSEFTEEDNALMESVLFSALSIYFALKILASQYEITRIAFFGDYAWWLPAALFARKLSIPVTRIDHGYFRDIDRRFIGLRPNSSNVHTFDHQIAQWPKYRDRPIEPAAITNIADSALFRLEGYGGVSTFSPNWIKREDPLQEELGLSRHRRTIVAFPSSSDEIVAIRNIMELFGKPYGQGRTPFRDQIEWLKALSDWVADRSDLQLVIRLHPRIGLSHRHTSVSTEYHHFRKAFKALPANVLVVWPEDKVSSYNLAEIADAALVSWSSMGLELARFGIPVVAAFSGLGAYPVGTFAAYEDNARDYFFGVEHAPDRRATMSNITEAFRWTHYLDLSPVVDMSDLIPTPDHWDVPPWRMPKNQGTVLRVLIDGVDITELNMQRLPRGSAAEARERTALLNVLNRILVFFVAGQEYADKPLEQIRLEANGIVDVVVNGKSFHRYSPLAHRLGAMLAENGPIEAPVPALSI